MQNAAATALCGLLFVAGCASAPAPKGVAASLDMPLVGPNSWQGRAADAANGPDRGPMTPALRSVQGRVPLVHLARGPWSEQRPHDASYELAVFADGTLVYEGHRCVKLGGLVLMRLDEDRLGGIRRFLAGSCVGLDSTTDDELCPDSGTLRVTCSNGDQVLSGSDQCRHDRGAGKRLAELASTLLDLTGVAPWLGEPTDRQSCEPGARDLAPHEISRTL
jgi:hypothetical protein